MTLQLIKMEDGVCDGEVLHHEFSKYRSMLTPLLLLTVAIVTKNKKDVLETKKRHQQRR